MADIELKQSRSLRLIKALEFARGQQRASQPDKEVSLFADANAQGRLDVERRALSAAKAAANAQGRRDVERRALSAAKAAARAQSAIKYPNRANALRHAVTEAQNAGSKEPTAFRLRITQKPTSPETVTLQRRPLDLKTSLQPAERSVEPVDLPVPVSTLPAEIRTVTSVSDVGELVRRTRKRQGMAQGDLATLAGTGRRFISELEAGKPTLEFERMLTVCRALGVDLFARVRNDGG